jgi:tungstate transport system substrate-binding protein
LAELALWNKDAGIDIEKANGVWYESAGRGMDATLHMASARDGYVLSDRGTWLHFKNKGNLQSLVAGDNRLFNQYAAILVNPDRHPNVRKEFGQAFIDWLVSPDGQKAIADYKINGDHLFFSNADDPNA